MRLVRLDQLAGVGRRGLLAALLIAGTAGAEEPRTAAEIVGALRHADSNVRLSAAEELQGIDLPSDKRAELVTAVLAALRDESRFDYRFVARLIKVLDGWGSDVSEILAHAIKHEDQELSLAIALALRENGPLEPTKLTDVVVPLTRSDDIDVRLRAIESIGILRLTTRAAMDALREAAADSGGRVRYRALIALHRTGDLSTETQRAFVTAVGESSPSISDRALQILAGLGAEGRDALPALRSLRDTAAADRLDEIDLAIAALEGAGVGGAAIKSPVEIVKPVESNETGRAALDLPQQNAPTAAPATESVTPLPSPADGMLEGLSRVAATDGDAVTIIGSALSSDRAEVRAAAAMKIAELHLYDAELARALGSTLRDDDATARFAAGYALRQFGKAAVEPLAGAAKDEKVLVRLNAVQALNPLQESSPDAARAIEERLSQDTDASVRIQSALALLRLRSEHPEALRLLVRTLPDASGELREKIVSSLRKAERARVLEILAVAVGSAEAEDRRGAVLAFTELDPESEIAATAIRNAIKDSDERVQVAAQIAAKKFDIDVEAP